MKNLKRAAAVLLSILLCMPMTAMAEEETFPGQDESVVMVTGAEVGTLINSGEKTDEEDAANETDEAEENEAESALSKVSMKKWQLSTEVPEDTIYAYDNDQAMYFYLLEENMIPYVMIDVYRFSDEDVFFEEAEKTLRASYEDLEIKEERSDFYAAQHKGSKIVYTYKIGNYQILDMRAVIMHGGAAYMIAAKDVVGAKANCDELLEIIVDHLEFTNMQLCKDELYDEEVPEQEEQEEQEEQNTVASDEWEIYGDDEVSCLYADGWDATIRYPSGMPFKYDQDSDYFYFYPLDDGYVPYVKIGKRIYDGSVEEMIDELTADVEENYEDMVIMEDPEWTDECGRMAMKIVYCYEVEEYLCVDSWLIFESDDYKVAVNSVEIPQLGAESGGLLQYIAGAYLEGKAREDAFYGVRTYKREELKDSLNELTIGRTYVPEGFRTTCALSDFTTDEELGISTPLRAVIYAFDNEKNRMMMYRSQSTYMYSDNTLIRNSADTVCPLVESMDASGYADYLIRNLYKEYDITVLSEEPETEAVASQMYDNAEDVYQIVSASMDSKTSKVSGMYSSMASRTYRIHAESSEEDMIAKVITETYIVKIKIELGSTLSYDLITWAVPYTYVYLASEDTYTGGLFDMAMFTANTQVSNEYLAASIELSSVLNSMDDSEEPEIPEYFLKDRLSGEVTYAGVTKGYKAMRDIWNYGTMEGELVGAPDDVMFVSENEDGDILVSMYEEQVPEDFVILEIAEE